MARDQTLGSRTAGVWTTAQARACGLSETGTLHGAQLSAEQLAVAVQRESGGRLVARFDLGDEQRRFAVEADGRRGQCGEVMRAKDGRRDKTAGRLGWATERVTWSELRTKQAWTLRRVVDAAEEHAPRR